MPSANYALQAALLFPRPRAVIQHWKDVYRWNAARQFWERVGLRVFSRCGDRSWHYTVHV